MKYPAKCAICCDPTSTTKFRWALFSTGTTLMVEQVRRSVQDGGSPFERTISPEKHKWLLTQAVGRLRGSPVRKAAPRVAISRSGSHRWLGVEPPELW